MHNNITLLHILRSNLKRYILLFLTLITSSVVMGQEITIPIKTVTADPASMTRTTGHSGDGHQSHAVNNLKDGNTSTTWIADQEKEYKMLEYLQITNVSSSADRTFSFIEIPYVPNQNTAVEIAFENTDEVFSNNLTQYIFGCGEPGVSGMSMQILGTDYHMNCATSTTSNLKDERGPIARNTKLTYILSAKGIDEVDANGNASTMAPFSNQKIIECTDASKKKNLCFFGNPGDATSMTYAGRIYSVKIRENGWLRYDLQPATYNGEAGFYDRISTSFFSLSNKIQYIQNTSDDAHVAIPLDFLPKPASGFVWSESLVKNGYLANALNTSTFQGIGGSGGKVSKVTENGVNAVKVISGTRSNDYSSQLWLNFEEPLYAGETYVVSFAYKASEASRVNAYLMGTGDPNQTNITTGSINFGTEWNTFTTTGTIPSGLTASRLGFHLNVENGPRDYYITNVVVKRQEVAGDDMPAADSGKKWSGNLVGGSTPSFNGGTINTSDGVVTLTRNDNPGSDAWSVQLQVPVINLTAGEKYYISFSYSANDAGNEAHSNVWIQKDGNTQTQLSPQITFGTEWKTQVFTGTVENALNPVNYLTFHLNVDKKTGAKYSFKDIVIKKQVDDPDPSPDSGKMWSRSLIVNGDLKQDVPIGDLTSLTHRGANSFTYAEGPNGSRAIAVENTKTSGNAWDTQVFFILGEEIKDGDVCYLSFDYKANTAQTGVGTQAHVLPIPNNSTKYGVFNNINFTTSWQHFSQKITYNNSGNGGMQAIALHLNKNATNTYYFANVVLKKQIDNSGNHSPEPAPVRELKIQFQDDNTSNEWSSARHLFSLGSDEVMALYSLIHDNDQGMQYNIVNGNSITTNIARKDGDIHTITIRPGQYKFDDASDFTTVTGGSSSWDAVDALYLLGTHCDNNANHNNASLYTRSFKGKIFSAVLTENGIPRLDLVPDYNGSEYGFLDKVSNTFYGKDAHSSEALIGPIVGGYNTSAEKTNDFKMPFKIDFTTDLYAPSTFTLTTAQRESGENQFNYNNPRRFVLYGSNDGTLWKRLDLTKPNSTDLGNSDGYVGMDFPNTTTQYNFGIKNNTNAFNQYRLIVENVIVANETNGVFTHSCLRLAELGLSAKYSFEHYVGRVYDDMGVQPDNLKIGGSSGYTTAYKNQNGHEIQRTHEYEHVVYVWPGQTVNLTPFSDFDANLNNETSWSLSYNYRELYIRWYDHNTDARSAQLTFDARNGHTVNGLDKGHFAWNRGGFNNYRTREGSVAKYTAPTSSNSDGVFDVIALEAANTFDWTKGRVADDGTYVIKEPTLQWRHTFVIKDASVRANEIYNNNANYINKNKITLMCPAGTPFQYPLPSFEYADSKTGHPTDYYNTNGNPIYHYLIETTDKNGNKKNTYLEFDSDGKAVSDGNKNTKVIYTSVNGNLPDAQTAYSYKAKDGYNRVFYMLSPQEGTYTIKIYALESNNSSGIQLMEYELQVLSEDKGNKLVPRETLLATNSNGEYTYTYQNQIPAEMERIYGTPTTYVNFDNIDPNEVESVTRVNLHKPVVLGEDQKAGGVYHYFKWPWQWENSSYGFGYEDRGDYNMYMVADHMAVTPNRGINNANDTEDDLSSSDVFDVSYYESKGTQKGYFFYANAASDPSRMAVLNIGQDFCPNTKVYVSAWINEIQHKNLYAETANVIFSFRGVKNGVETVLNSYVTGYVSGGWNTPIGYKAKTAENENNGIHHVDATNNPDYRGQWMHVYYTFSTTHTEEYDYYIITLENNCTSSEGADYAIDDIRAYVLKPNLQARLMDPVCDKTTGTKIEIYGNFEQLKDAFFPEDNGNINESLKYCFLDKDVFDNTYKTNPDNAFSTALIANVYGSGQSDYGVLTFNSSFSNNLFYNESWYIQNEFNNYYKGHKPEIGDIIIFPCDATDVHITPGKSYILAIAKTTDANFDVTGKCSRTSVFRIPNPADIKIDGTLQTSEGGVSACANQRPEVTIDMNGVSMGGTPVTAEVLKFDWYYGPLSLGDISDENSPKYQGYTRSYENEKSEGDITLHSILSKFRELNATADDDKVLGATADNSNEITINVDFTQDMLLYLKSLVQEGRLTLYKDKAFATAHLFGENLDPAKQKYFYMTALPINPEQQVKDNNPEINSVKFCLDPIGVSIKINELTPAMKDGDGQVTTYPEDLNDVPLRIGLKQLKRTVISNLADNSTKEQQLWLPLRAIAPVTEDGQAAGTTLIMNADDLLYLVDSNDPEAMEAGSGASISGTNITDKVVVIGKLMEITAVKNGSNNVCKLSFLKSFKFREGYWYTMKFHFSQHGASDQVCPGDLIFTIKVVPEYQMWTGAVSRNWNDDENWRRVTKEDLLWSLNNADVKNSDFLSANADYISDGGTNENAFSFAPADFTKVIIPADVERVPFMYDMRSSSTTSLTYIGAPSEGLQITNGDPTDETIIGKPTENVIYDMASIDRSDNDVATRPWYDHTCDQIHFNTGAILMDQRYLYYNKAWCDIDVPVGTWQTVASPLMNIVAGDLYLPTATARQQTPLFEDIYYQTDLNDRFKPAVFQRSWNKSMAKVYKLDGNMDNVGIKLDWSHVYNDVNVRYGAGQGFSIKVDVSAMPTGDQPTIARFRFPKADKQYTYYNPGNADGEKKTEQVNSEDIVGGVRTGKLSDLSGTFQQMVGDTGNNQNPATPTNYFLVGNPLICWLNMQKFFEVNNQFESKYWIATADGQRTALFSETEGWVSTLDGDAQFLAPGVSFFVELKQNSEDVAGQVPSAQISVTPQFTADMMSYVQGEKSPTTNNDGSNPNSRAAEQSYIPQLRLTAEDGNGRKSVAVLTDGTVAEHDMVETLFDSNLKDDIFLYTTKNGQAQSIANIVSGDTLPLVTAGLVDDVMLHIEGAENFDCPLYIIDSEEGTIEPLTSDITLNCTTRGVRYYITSPGEKDEEMTISTPRVTAGNGCITIYAPANAAIEWAEIHSTNGTLVEKENDIDYSYSAILPSAIYLVRLSVEGHVYTYKLLLTDK